MRRRAVKAGSLAVLALAFVVAGCGEDRNDSLGPDLPKGAPVPGGTAVSGLEREWDVAVDLDRVPAGPVTFTFKNVGTVEHEMLVVRTDIPVGELPVDPSTGRFAEESDSWEVIDEISEYAVGETKDLTVDLRPGTFQLVCNIPTHYANGMATAFTVFAD